MVSREAAARPMGLVAKARASMARRAETSEGGRGCMEKEEGSGGEGGVRAMGFKGRGPVFEGVFRCLEGVGGDTFVGFEALSCV